MAKKDIITLANDLILNKVTEYSADDANEVLRKAFYDLLGAKEGEKISRTKFRRHKIEVFEILEEVLNTNLDTDLRNQLDNWVEYRNEARGDRTDFIVPDDQLFKVAIISDGNQNLLRQRVRPGERLTVGVNNYGVKIYEEFDLFLTGQIDWVQMVQNVGLSIARQVRDDVVKAIVDNFPEEASEHLSTTVGAAASEREVLTLAEKIRARTRQNVSIYGTKLALHKIQPEVTSDAQDGERNAIGYYSSIAGVPMYELEQSLESGGTDFALDNDFLLILPDSTNNRMVKVVNEGEAWIEESTGERNASMDKEYIMTNRVGIAIVPSSVYGYVKFTD